MTLVIDDIGLLVTCDPTRGEGSLGLVRNAAVIVEGGRVLSIEKAGARADTRISAEGRCVMPGFVDSHTHLVFAGDRSDEFAARMAGTPYSAGGITTTVAATRAASTEDLGSLAVWRRYAALVSGTTHVEVKSGYGLDVEHEQRLCQIAGGLTDDVTFLGAHTVPPEYTGRVDAYVDLVCGEMLTACAPFARWIDVFCEVGTFDVDQSRAVLQRRPCCRARAAGTCQPARLRARRGTRGRRGRGIGGPLHLPQRWGSRGARCERHGGDLSPRERFLDSPALSRCATSHRRGATVAIASNCNPGSSYTSSMAFCITLAVRDMHMTVEEAVRAATIGGAKALRRVDVGWLGPGSRADAVILDAPTYVHLASRPGMALAHDVIERGRAARPLSVFHPRMECSRRGIRPSGALRPSHRHARPRRDVERLGELRAVGAALPRIEQLLRGMDADIVGMQEVFRVDSGHVAEIAEKLGLTYTPCIEWFKPARLESGTAVLSRWPVSDTGSLKLAGFDGGDGGLVAIRPRRWPTRADRRVRGHARLAPGPQPCPPGAGARAATYVNDTGSPAHPVLILGDFNAGPVDEMRMLVGQSQTAAPGLVFYDAWEVASEGGSGHTSRAATDMPRRPCCRIAASTTCSRLGREPEERVIRCVARCSALPASTASTPPTTSRSWPSSATDRPFSVASADSNVGRRDAESEGHELGDVGVGRDAVRGVRALLTSRGDRRTRPESLTTLRDALGLDGRGRLLDAGCGPGRATLLLSHLFAEVVGLDPDGE